MNIRAIDRVPSPLTHSGGGGGWGLGGCGSSYTLYFRWLRLGVPWPWHTGTCSRWRSVALPPCAKNRANRERTERRCRPSPARWHNSACGRDSPTTPLPEDLPLSVTANRTRVDAGWVRCVRGVKLLHGPVVTGRAKQCRFHAHWIRVGVNKIDIIRTLTRQVTTWSPTAPPTGSQTPIRSH